MGVARMLANKNRLELSLVVSREIKLLLTDQRIRPRTSLMLIKLPALPVIDPRELLLRNGPVDLNPRHVDRAAAPEDQILLVLPEPGLVVQLHFTCGHIVQGGDRTAEQKQVAGQLPQPDFAKRCGYNSVIVLLALRDQLEGVLAPVDGDLV